MEGSFLDVFSPFIGNYSEEELHFFHEFLGGVKLPSLDSRTFSKLSSKFSEGLPMNEVLAPVRHLFKYDSRTTSNFQCLLMEKGSPSTAHRAVLFFIVLSWFSEMDLVSILEGFETMVYVILMFNSVLGQATYSFLLYSLVYSFIDTGTRPFPRSFIRKVFIECTPYNFDLIIIVLNRCLLNRDDDSSSYLINLLTSQLSTTPEIFMDNDLQILVSTIYQPLCEFNDESITLLSVLSTLKLDNSIMETFIDMPIILLKKISSRKIKMPSEIIDDFITLDNSMSTVEYPFQITSKNTFPEGLSPPASSCFESTLSFDHFFSSDEIRMISRILLIMSRAHSNYIDAFFDSFTKLVDSNSFLIYLYMLSHIGSCKINEMIYELLTGSIVFQPGITVFSQFLGLEEIIFVRRTVLQILNVHSPTLIAKLFSTLEYHPFLFAELIGFIHSKLSSYISMIFCEESVLSAIMRVSSFLNVLYFQGSNIEVIQKARSTIFVFLFSIIQNESVTIKCFSSAVFASGFLSRLLEPALQQPILSAFKSFLSLCDKSDVSLSLRVVEFVCGIMNVCRSLEGDLQANRLVIEVMLCVNDSLVRNSSQACIFKPVFRSASLFLCSNPSKPLLNQVLILCSLLSSEANAEFSLSYEDAILLSNASRAAEEIVVSELTLSGIIGILTKSRSSNITSMFLIQQPIIIRVLFSILRSEEQTKQFIELFTQLCKYSLKNCLMCHEGCLDLLLVEFLYSYPNEFLFRGCTYNMQLPKDQAISITMPLLSTIYAVSSSNQIANRLLSVIVPNDNGIFPCFSDQVMKELSLSLGLISKQPKITSHLGYTDSFITIEGVKASSINKGFTFQFWLIIDGPASQISSLKPVIFEISDGDKVQLKVIINGLSIICSINSPQGVSYAPLTSYFPSCSWSLATIIVEFGNNGSSSISFTFNDLHMSTYSAPLNAFKEGYLTVRIGGVAESNFASTHFECCIGDFWFYPEPLDKKRISELNNMGARASDVGILPLFSYPSSINASGITIHPPAVCNHSRTSLVDAFSSSKIGERIIPLFSHIDIMPNHFPEQLLDLVKCSIQLMPSINFFSIISNSLLMCSPQRLTYSLYMKFFSLLEVCPEKQISKELIEQILVNPEIWCACEANHLQRIVSHWSSGLFNAAPNLFIECRSLSSLLVILRLYFWYEPIEIEILRGHPNSNRPRPTNLDVAYCRNQIGRLLIAISLIKFTKRDAIAFLSHYTTIPDQKQAICLVQVLIEILRTISGFSGIPKGLSPLLYCQFKPSNEERFCTALKLLYLLSGNSFFSDHLFSVIAIYPEQFVTEDLLNTLKGCMNQYPLIFPICCHMAVNINDHAILEIATMIESINFDQEQAKIIIENPLWCIPLVSMIINGPSCVQEIIISFIVKIFMLSPSIPALDSIIVLYDYFSLVTEIEIEEISKTLIVRIAENVLSRGLESIYYHLSSRCLKALLFRLNSSICSDALQSLFDSSVFSITDIVFSESQALKQRSLTSFKDILLVFQDVPPKFLFQLGIRLDSSTHPSDSELLSTTLKLLQNSPIIDDSGKFWLRNLSSIISKSPRSKSMPLELFSFIPAYYDVMTRYYSNAIKRFHTQMYQLMSIYSSNGENSISSFTEREFAVSSNDVDLYLQTVFLSQAANDKKLRALTRHLLIGLPKFFDSNCIQEFSIKHVATNRYLFSRFKPLIKRSIVSSKVYYVNSNSLFNSECCLITVGRATMAHFVIYDNRIEIQRVGKISTWEFPRISRVLLRNRYHKPTALEFYLSEPRKSFLIDFSPKYVSDCLKCLIQYLPIAPKKIQKVSMQLYFPSLAETQNWAEGKISNFEYLIRLNLYCGRSFNDISIYPIFPWIITDFDSIVLDFKKKSFFRDLSFPIYHEKNIVFMTSPSNPTFVSHLLSSIHPFSQLNEQYRNEQFSLGNCFNSVKDSFLSIINKMYSCELPPEFYFSHEFFSKNIVLPSWASDSLHFVYQNRKALECDYVSSNLNQWIDLVFGANTHGQKASEMGNIYNLSLFENVWQKWNEITEDAIIKILKSSGQMPACIFPSPHPQRIVKDTSPIPVPIKFSLELDHVVFSGPASYSNNCIESVLLSDNGMVYKISVDPLNTQKFDITSFIQGVYVNPKSICASIKYGSAFYDNSTNIMTYLTKKSVSSKYIKFNADFLKGNGQNVILGNRNGSVCVFNIKQSRILHTFSICEDYITCMAYSNQFKVIVCGTESNSIVSYELSGKCIFSIELNDIPKSITITPTWGFIIVELSKEMVLITQNGMVYRRTSIDFSPRLTETWTYKGGDYLLLSDDRGKLRMIEAINLHFCDPFYNCRSDTVSLKYVERMNSIAVVTRDAHYIIIPVPL